MLRVMLSLVELRDMFMEKRVTLTFARAKKELHRNLLKEEGGNAVNGSKDENLGNSLARQIAIIIEPTPDLL